MFKVYDAFYLSQRKGYAVETSPPGPLSEGEGEGPRRRGFCGSKKNSTA